MKKLSSIKLFKTKLSSLGAKFSLLLALVWFVGGSATILTLSHHLNAQAEQTMRERADIVLTAMQAARNYTQNNIQPLVKAQVANVYAPESASSDLTAAEQDMADVADDPFIQEIIPNFAARRIFDSFRREDPSFLDYSYKEAAINPTNANDLADSFEAQLYPQLQPLDGPLAESVSGYRTLEGKKLFYMAQPLIMKDASCLACHGNPADAPKAFLKMYGDRNGFGWNLDQVVATQMVYVPADMIFARGRQNLWTVTKTFLSIFGALFVVINVLLWRNVVRPLGILTGTAHQISRCSLTHPVAPSESHSPSSVSAEAAPPGAAISLADENLSALTLRQDEPGQLARAFEYMLYVLNQREQDLQQAVDERTRLLSQEMRERQTAQFALQTYTHAMNHDLRNVAMGISSVVQGIVFRYNNARQNLADQNPETQGQTNWVSDPISAETTTDETTTDDSTTDLNGVTVDVEALSLLQKSCDRQLTLMDTLMQVRSADTWRAALRYSPVNLHALVTSILIPYAATTNGTATFKNLIPETLPPIQGDASQIQRVFTNLIDNALKYNPNGVNIVLSATLVSDADATNAARSIRCQVSDDGQGLNTANGKTLFEPYYRNDQTTTGYGLGLYICREIIRAHGGAMGIASVEGGTGASKGATFWFTLPLLENSVE
ncbi:MAG: DUF3365 domain-containing protein [Phormidesmis sp.]